MDGLRDIRDVPDCEPDCEDVEGHKWEYVNTVAPQTDNEVVSYECTRCGCGKSRYLLGQVKYAVRECQD
jgi:hypothetical protein